MPVLKNPKHEAFAQGLAGGKSADQAYQDAGFSANRGNATRLKAKESVAARVAELTESVAETVKEAISFDARAQFERLERTCQKAEEAGDHKTAAEYRSRMLQMFGYLDHPTLTHEHVNNRRVDVHQSDTGQKEQAIDSAPNVSRFGEAAKKYRQ